MKPLSQNLTELIVDVQALVQHPKWSTPTLPSQFAERAAEIRQVHVAPCDASVRATCAGAVMCDMIEAFFETNPGDDRWLMLIGATLPLLRIDAWQAMRNEKAVAEESRR